MRPAGLAAHCPRAQSTAWTTHCPSRGQVTQGCYRPQAFNSPRLRADTTQSAPPHGRHTHPCRALDVDKDASLEQNVPAGVFEDGREGQSRQVLFNRIAPIYDELNERLSFGQHRVWKRMTVKWSGARPGHHALDVCCGTGDLTFLLAQAVGHTGKVTGLDFAQEMLDDAAVREQREASSRLFNQLPQISWVQGDAMDLPFEDNTFDAITMGYGLRNVADIPKALQQLHRVVKPGCSVAILDFNNSTNPTVDSFQAWFLENVVVPAAAEQGVEQEYRYLRPSIKRFPTGQQQEELAKAAGFASARHYDIGFGLMGVLVAQKEK